MLNVSVYVSESLHKLSVNLAEKINIPRHSDSHCHCIGSMISSTSEQIILDFATRMHGLKCPNHGQILPKKTFLWNAYSQVKNKMVNIIEVKALINIICPFSD